jgi:hypothetical protein
VKCYIDNSVHLRSYIRNVNKHFWLYCQGGSQYLVSVYRLHRIIQASFISLANLSTSLCLCVVFTGKILFGPEPPTIHPSFWTFTSRFCSIELLGALIRQVREKSSHKNPRMTFKQLAGESIAEAWERYHLFMADLPVAGMEDWDFTQGFYYGLSQEAKEHIDNLARGTFFFLKIQEARALFEKITASERESEKYDAKENSHATKIDPLTQKFRGLTLNQTSVSEEHRVEQKFQAQPSDGKKRSMSKISGDAILDKLRNRMSEPALPMVPCILGPFKGHHALYDWGASMNIFPKMIYDCLDEDSLVLTSQWLHLADSTVVQPYGIAENVLIEFHDSSTLVDFMVMDIDPHQKTSIILEKPFPKSVRAIIDKTRGTINIKVDGVHEKFIYHPKNLACCC